MGHSLTAHVKSFHPHVDSRVRMLNVPIVPCLQVSFANGELDHRRAPHASMALNLRKPTLPCGELGALDCTLLQYRVQRALVHRMFMKFGCLSP
jgi:hypothetical protein